MTLDELAQMIDHTNLHADATEADMKKLCDEAIQWHFRMVAINSCQTEFCHKYLAAQHSDVHTGAAIGFPLGQQTIASKVFEARDAIEHGADEIDYVVNLTQVKQGNREYVKREMKAMVDLCHANNVLCKVIFETCYLTKEQIVWLGQIAKEVKPDFIKTSTGFGRAGATVENVALMKQTVGDSVQVKAAGGIHSLDKAMDMIVAGAARIGTSSGVKIMEEYKQKC